MVVVLFMGLLLLGGISVVDSSGVLNSVSRFWVILWLGMCRLMVWWLGWDRCCGIFLVVGRMKV